MPKTVELPSAQMNLEATLVAIRDSWLLLSSTLIIEAYRTTDPKFVKMINPPLGGRHFIDLIPDLFKANFLEAFSQADGVGVVHDIPFEATIEKELNFFSASIATKHPMEDFTVAGYIVIIRRTAGAGQSLAFC